jgi:hypothetical protein
MGLFSKKPSPFVSEAAFDQTLRMQTTLSPQTVQELRKYGVTDTSLLKLEYFFYTNSRENGLQLANDLRAQGYSADCRPGANQDGLFVITGWTTPLRMNTETVVKWTESMCRAGFAHDYDFDGWGTDPHQSTD